MGDRWLNLHILWSSQVREENIMKSDGEPDVLLLVIKKQLWNFFSTKYLQFNLTIAQKY
jgi:hypothetical protein